ncbi:hypothetical protein ABH19_09185 [Leptospirillum sp. Group II 'CF-1']|nr:hypothetical protein ABH19_09185 [Leptospirillum sp. Group II 'CF-1']
MGPQSAITFDASNVLDDEKTGWIAKRESHSRYRRNLPQKTGKDLARPTGHCCLPKTSGRRQDTWKISPEYLDTPTRCLSSTELFFQGLSSGIGFAF